MTKTALLNRVAGLCRTRHLSLATERAYCGWVGRFFEFSKRCRELPAQERARLFLEDMAPRVSASTQAQSLNALAFLFNQVLGTRLDFGSWAKAKRSKRLPSWLSREEITSLLGEMSGTPRLMAGICYGSGLRLMECVRLRVKDIDVSQGIVVVRDGKGGKDRVTCLPAQFATLLGARLRRLRELWQADRRDSLPGVQLPGTLEAKYPRAGEEWPWQWLFPGRDLSRDHRSGTVRRHHVHENTLQKAVAVAAVRAKLTKRVTVHVLRHSFATHLLEDGCDIEKLRQLLGHERIQTTAIYLHTVQAFAGAVRSPLDRQPSKVVAFPCAPALAAQG